MGSSSKLGHDPDFSASFQRKVLAQLVAQFLAILGQPRLFRVIPTKSPGPLLSKTGPKLGQTGPAGPETGPRLIFVLRNGPENWATGPPLAQVCVTNWATLFQLRANIRGENSNPCEELEFETSLVGDSRHSGVHAAVEDVVPRPLRLVVRHADEASVVRDPVPLTPGAISSGSGTPGINSVKSSSPASKRASFREPVRGLSVRWMMPWMWSTSSFATKWSITISRVVMIMAGPFRCGQSVKLPPRVEWEMRVTSSRGAEGCSSR